MPKTIDDAVAHLDQAIARIPERYEKGINRANWADPAASDTAEALWWAGLEAARAARRRIAGIQRVGNQTWRRLAVEKGGPVIGTRLRDALGKYRANFAPVMDAMLRVLPTLKPKTPDPMANVDNRVKPVVRAAREASPKRKGG